MDYSIVVAETLRIPLEEMHQRHRKLRELGGLKRVEGRIIHYRKNIVKGKWIKHRNHTYYELTPEGEMWVEAFENEKNRPEHRHSKSLYCYLLTLYRRDLPIKRENGRTLSC